MNKIKQNKVTFSLILLAIIVIFSSFTILSLPVLFNYKSKLIIIEKNFYKNFKIYLKASGNITYKPFPRPHLLLENASLNLSEKSSHSLINTSNLKIYISLRDIYLRSFKKYLSTEIIDTNLEIKVSEIKEIRKHLYQKVNNPIIFKNCKLFIKNEKDQVILISPIKNISYKIKDKIKTKSFFIDGEVFGINFKSDWKRNYENSFNSFHNINLFNPNIEIKNKFNFEKKKNFKINTKIDFMRDKIEYNLRYNKNKISISSPEGQGLNYNISSDIQFKPFYFEGSITIKNQKIENFLDNILSKLLLYNENYLGNLNGLLKIKLKNINNKVLKNGELNFSINEKKINLVNANFKLDKIGDLVSIINSSEKQGDIFFISQNTLTILDHIEFAKVFQISSKKVKNIKQINFNLEKELGKKEFSITNVKINNIENNQKSNQIFFVKNIQNLRMHIRKVID